MIPGGRGNYISNEIIRFKKEFNETEALISINNKCD